MPNRQMKTLTIDGKTYEVKDPSALVAWMGTEEEYEEIETPDPNTLYLIVEEEDDD